MQSTTGVEERTLLTDWSVCVLPYPHDKTISQLFEEQVARTPNTLAVVYEGRRLTYTELNERANRIARYLRSRGVGPDRLVALCVDRSLDLVIGLMGIMKAGGAYVALDPEYPSERLSYMLGDAAPTAVLTQQHLMARVPATTVEVIALDRDWDHIARYNSSNLDLQALAGPHNLAYVIYTSGSTGRPKGVMIEHRSIANLWRGLEEIYKASKPCQHIALNASINFDASVQQWVQLISGRTLFVVPHETRRDASLMLRFLEENKIDGIDCTPSQLGAWISAGLLEIGTYSPRVILVGGEAIDQQLWSALTRCAEVEFFNVYGPTECTVDATVARLSNDATGPHIGRPMANRNVYILDASKQPVPIGVVGEIHIGGVGIARGYLNRPELTADRFVCDPFSSDAGARLYKTGDLGRWRSDGAIEYLGRNDHQVKIRGLRVELGEIETQLMRHSGVKSAVVTVQGHSSGEKRLVAHLTRHDQNDVTAAELRDYLRAELPEHMVPSAFVFIETMPLTPSGKLDRSALPSATFEADTTHERDMPRGDLEETLAIFWQELLHVEQVGRQDNFFDRGGDSLGAMKLAGRIARRFRIRFYTHAVFRYPVFDKMAAFIASLPEQRTADPA